MAVIAMWKCDRDDAMFDTKKDAEAHDKMLELAESISAFVGRNVSGLDEAATEEIGLALAKKADALVLACKGKPEALLMPDKKESPLTPITDVTPITEVSQVG